MLSGLLLSDDEGDEDKYVDDKFDEGLSFPFHGMHVRRS